MKIAAIKINKNRFVGNVANAVRWKRRGAAVIHQHIIGKIKIKTAERYIVIDNAIHQTAAIHAAAFAQSCRDIEDNRAISRAAIVRTAAVASGSISENQ